MNEFAAVCEPLAAIASGPVVAMAVKAHTLPQNEHFSEAQWRELRAQDTLAGTAVVMVMTTIFTLGFFGYVFIAWLCAQG